MSQDGGRVFHKAPEPPTRLHGAALRPLTQWSWKLCVITAEPKDRAGLILQPV